MINNYSTFFLFFSKILSILLVSLFCVMQCQASTFENVVGIYVGKNTSSAPAQYCSPAQQFSIPQGEHAYGSSTCSLDIPANNYPPVSGTYRMITLISPVDYRFIGSEFYLDSSKSISEQHQSLDWGRFDLLDYPVTGTQTMCYYLRDPNNNVYMFNGINYGSCPQENGPIPPPPQPPTSCNINNSNDLNINLGTLDRAQLVTVPGTGTARHVQIPVDCSGGNVSVNMALNYSPLTVSGKDVIQSSANGLGISIIYNEATLSPTDVVPLNFIMGSNTLDLAFEAVRDPNVTVGDIPTGEFTASATVIMTQQ